MENSAIKTLEEMIYRNEDYYAGYKRISDYTTAQSSVFWRSTEEQLVDLQQWVEETDIPMENENRKLPVSVMLAKITAELWVRLGTDEMERIAKRIIERYAASVYPNIGPSSGSQVRDTLISDLVESRSALFSREPWMFTLLLLELIHPLPEPLE